MILTALALLASAQAAEPKVDCDNAMTQMAMNICAGREYQASDRELNAVWKKAASRAKETDKAVGGGTQHRELLAAQRAWLTYRDAHCSFEANQYRGGSIMPLIRSTCLTALTEARTKQLREYLEFPG
ncbi:lysozyme inhibitor LprI family protein [Alteriqipengyuania sp. 357]